MPRSLKTKKIVSKSSRKKVILKVPKSTLLKHPHATLTFTSFASLALSITVQASIENERVSEIGFACEQSPSLLRYLQLVGEKVLEKTPEEVEKMELKIVMDEIQPSNDERLMVNYAFSAWKDVVSRLPTPDPLSGALQSIKFYHREFPRGTLLPDLED